MHKTNCLLNWYEIIYSNDCNISYRPLSSKSMMPKSKALEYKGKTYLSPNMQISVIQWKMNQGGQNQISYARTATDMDGTLHTDV